MTERIDAHHHLWKYTAAEYGWLDGPMGRLQRDFLPHDLTRETAAAGIDGTVVVQARQTVEETHWLLNLADTCDAIRGVVGWAPIASPEFPAMMEEFAGRPKLKGLRHVIQGEKDERYILREDFNAKKYHQPKDEWSETLDFTGEALDVTLLYNVGRSLADSTRWPEWKAGSEFKALRDQSAQKRH